MPVPHTGNTGRSAVCCSSDVAANGLRKKGESGKERAIRIPISYKVTSNSG